MSKDLIVLGIRGIPANHGGFETFAQYLSEYLFNRDWNVTVYCQVDGSGEVYETEWHGIRLINIPVSTSGALGTIIFDLKSTLHSLRHKGLYLTLGYNTAIFCSVFRLFRKVNIINMDGIEWKRQKWGLIPKLWFWMNERFGCWFGNHLVADHPRIEDHLATRVSRKKITMIPYGAAEVNEADEGVLAEYGVEKNQYSIIIARPEPENSILEIVTAFSKVKRDQKLIVLGNFSSETNPYHRSIMNAASDEVLFPGAIYDFAVVGALRFYARFYIHGHQVGGTNPSLVEAMGAGCAIIAHDNKFNRWVAGDGAHYFSGVEDLGTFFAEGYNDDSLVIDKKTRSKQKFIEDFQWDSILSQYENLLLEYSTSSATSAEEADLT
jgi:glycosyltransferase involved in cell wall biosynthesis